MAQQTINTGTQGNDHTGDDLRTGATKINDNFTEVYANINTLQVAVGVSGGAGISFDSGGIRFEGTTADSHETLLIAGDPTADRTITLPDSSGTLVLSSQVAAIGQAATVSLINSTVDASYIALRTGVGQDSGETLTLIRANAVDSADVINLVDSDYVQSRQINIGLDSSQVLNLIDTNLDLGTFDSVNFNYLRVDGSHGNSGAATVIAPAAQRYGMSIQRNFDDAQAPAALVISGDMDGNDIAFEIRGNSNGPSVNTTKKRNNSDTRFLITHGGKVVVGSAVDSTLSQVRNSSLLSIYGDATVDRMYLDATDSGGITFDAAHYGGAGDTATIQLLNDSSDALALTMSVGNDNNDKIKLSVPNDNNVEINNNTVLHHGNVDNFVDSDYVQARADTVKLKVYSVATSPNSGQAGQVIYVSDGNSGLPCLAVYDSASNPPWARVALGATISI
jgi:hypothetical protein